MTQLKATVLTKRAEEKIVKVSPRIVKRLIEGMQKMLIKMQSHVKTNKLSGQVLSRRTGFLSRSIHQDMKIDARGIVGRVFAGKDAPYAAVHEFGGTFNIPSHQRTQTMAFGRPITPRQVMVRAHMAKYPMRSFLRTTLAEFSVPFRNMVVRAVQGK